MSRKLEATPSVLKQSVLMLTDKITPIIVLPTCSNYYTGSLIFCTDALLRVQDPSQQSLMLVDCRLQMLL